MSENTQAGPSPRLALDEYDRIVGKIYSGALHTEHLHAALEELRVLFGANFASLILHVSEAEDVALMLVAGSHQVEGRVALFKYFPGDTPLARLPVDRVFCIEDLMSMAEWESSRYYREYARPSDAYHVMGADLTTQSGVIGLRISRGHGQPAFSEQDRALCARLLPHLRCSLDFHDLLERRESMGNLYSEAVNRLSIASLVLDEAGNVLQLNAVARTLLAQADGLKLVGTRLEASYPSDNRELYRFIRYAAESRDRQTAQAVSGAISVARPSGQVSLGVVIEPIRSSGWVEGRGQPVVMVYVRDAVGDVQMSSKVAQELFAFTPAETTLALELANGLSLEETAEKLGITRNTARAHLRSIFAKTGIKRQAELVRVMLNSVVSLGLGEVAPLEQGPVPVVIQPEQRFTPEA